jgi:hypothetical protein
VLRRLLNSGDYSRAWRSVGFEKEPKVVAPDLEKELKEISQANIVFAQAGGASYQGMQIATVTLFKGRDPRPSQMIETEFGLTGFLESTCVIDQGKGVRRRRVIDYVANKVGGAHLDQTRDPIRDLDFVLLDNNQSDFFGKPGVYFELLSIGQAVARSEDAKKFMDRARQVWN